MDFFIRSAMAEAGGAGAGGGFASLIPLIILFVVFYFLLIRPQTKRVKEHKEMVEALSKGNEIVTNGGLAGKVVDLDENFILVEIAPNIEVKVQRQAVNTVLPKGTIKSTFSGKKELASKKDD